jgi:hypothetical protein
MAASILRGALPHCAEGNQMAKELIAADEGEYEKFAIKLANGLIYRSGVGHGRLIDIRKVLFDNRWKCSLFNTKRWVTNLETAYERAWQNWVSGSAGDIHL